MRGTMTMFALVGGIVGLTNMALVPEKVQRPAEPALTEEFEIPDFAAIDDPAKRKRLFFEFLEPHVQQVNREIAGHRHILESVREELMRGAPLSTTEEIALPVLARRYRVPMDAPSVALVDKLLRRVDVLPPSLVLAQAAAESAWGTSRFARSGNAIFGQWCFNEGCGLVPEERLDGKKHQVRSFATVMDSVRAYFRNINTHPAYAELRELRARERDSAEGLRGPRLAAGLTRYSERRDAYVEEIRSIIEANQLERLDLVVASLD